MEESDGADVVANSNGAAQVTEAQKEEMIRYMHSHPEFVGFCKLVRWLFWIAILIQPNGLG